LRTALKGNAHLDTHGFYAALERLERYEWPLTTHTPPKLVLFGPDGPLGDETDLCWPDTGVAVRVPPLEGIMAFLDPLGMSYTFVAVDRQYIGLIEDPWTWWPDSEHPELPADNERLFALLG
jgi:hypothetical protein